TISPMVTPNASSDRGCYTPTWHAMCSTPCGDTVALFSFTRPWTKATLFPYTTLFGSSGDLGCEPPTEAPVFTGTDNCEGTITPVVTTAGSSTPGAYTQTWTANYTEACGNAADPVSITWTWTQDTEAPAITTDAESGDL